MNGRIDKGRTGPAGGAAGMILYNAIERRTSESDNHYLPAIHIDGPTALLHELRDRPHERDGHVGAGHRRSRGRPT